MNNEELTLWCHKLMFCDNYEHMEEPFDMDMMKVNRTISEFQNMNKYDQSLVMAYVIGQLTDYRKQLFGRKTPPEGYLPKQIERKVKCELCNLDVAMQDFNIHMYILHTVK